MPLRKAAAICFTTLTVGCLVTMSSTILCPSIIAQESGAGESQFENSDVIALAAAGLSDDLIIQKIKQAPDVALDASTDAILELTEAGVSEAIIQAVLGRVESGAVPQRSQSRSPTPQETTGSAGVAQSLAAGSGASDNPKWKFWKKGARGGSNSNGSGARTGSPRGGDTFLNSDDYRGGEEIVDVFLTAPDYARMYEEFEYRGVEFDWAWVKGTYGGRKGRQFVSPGFNVRGYNTIRISAQNFSPGLVPDLEGQVRAYFVEAMKRLGLTVVGDGQGAELELGIAIVDYKADSTYAFVAMIDPFVELEMRLRDLGSGEDLMLIRNQDHSGTAVQGAGDSAASLMRLLQ